MLIRAFSSLLIVTAMTLPVWAAPEPYPDSADGYDSSDYSFGYDSGPSSGSTSFTSRAGMPTQAYFELLGPMDSRRSHGSLEVQNWMTNINLCKMSSGSWGFFATTALRLTWLNGEGADVLDVDRLCTIWLNMNASYNITGKTRLMFGINPQISTDFDTWTHNNFFFGGHVMLAGPLNDRFSYGIGLGYYPQMGNDPLLPLFQFKWKTSNRWALQLEGPRLSYVNKVSEGFIWGPFVSMMSGTWTIHRDRRVRQFDWFSGVAGVGTQVGLGRWGGVRPKLMADVGFSFANSATFRTSNGSHELEKYHYDPGFYLKVGLEFAF